MEKYIYKCKDCGSKKYHKNGDDYICDYCGSIETVHFEKQNSNLEQIAKANENAANQSQTVLATRDEEGSENISETATTISVAETKKEIVSAEDKAELSRICKVVLGPSFIKLLICFFTGIFGGHKFYEGKIGWGILYLLTAGLFGVGYVVDVVLCAVNYAKDIEKGLLK